MITTALSPNLQADDVWLSLQLWFQPWKWQHGEATVQLRSTLQNYFSTQTIWPVNSGRTALLTILQSLQLEPEDEVLMQAFTCNAVCNPVRWAGAKPVYVDIAEDSFNMSAADLEKKITARSKVLIIQHTFGQPADLTPLLYIAKKHNLFVIEDCAHALGARYQDQLVGTFGDAAIFSFGRDKVISSVYGGALLIKDVQLAKTIADKIATLPSPTISWTAQQLIHPFITTISRWIPGVLTLAQRSKLISLAVSRAERYGQKPYYFPAQLPNALAALAVQQFNKLSAYNQRRLEIAQRYQQSFKPSQPLANGVWLRYSIRVQQPLDLFAKAKQAGLILGDWYWSVIVPTGGSLEQYGYQAGSCPVAENVAEHTINLPTHIRLSDADVERIIQFIKPFVL